MDKSKCAVYARVSTDEQAKGDSIQHQIEYFKEYANRNGLEIIEEYIDEGVSGTKAESRAAFLKMLLDARQGKFQIILVKSISRLARNLRLAVDTIYDLIERDIRLVTIEDSIDTSKPDARLLLGIHATLAEQESERTSARVKFGKNQKAKRGYYTGSYPPYGFVRLDKNRIIPANDETTEVVKQIYQMYLDGIGMRAIAKNLNRDGILSPSSQRGVSGYSGLWNDRTIKLILTNQAYAGTLVQGRSSTKSSISGKRLKNDNAIIAKNAIRPVIDREVFDRVQNLLNCSPDRILRSELHLFTGMIHCGDCGSRMYYRSKGYVCSKYSRFGNVYCTSHYIGEKFLLDIVREDIKTQLSNPQQIEEIIKAVMLKSLENSSFENNLPGRLDKRLEGLKKRLAQLLECFSENMINKEDFSEQLQLILSEKKEVLNQRSKLEQESERVKMEHPERDIENSLKDALDIKDPSPVFLHSLIDRIIISGDNSILIDYHF